MIPDRSRNGESYRDRSLSMGDRGQLLLVGAIAIALVLMGLVVVFNTVLYTDTTAPTETLESANEAQAFNQQARNDSRQILWRVANNSSSGGSLPVNYDVLVRENMSKYSDLMGISYADTGPVYVNVSVNDVGNGSTECPSATVSDPLCMNFTVTYSTQEFSYEKTNEVTTESPV